MTHRQRKRPGFTLLELLVSTAVIAVLIAMLLPAVQSARASARRVRCQNQMRQLAVGLHMYHDSYLCFPAGTYVMGPSFPTLTGWGWGAMVLPFVEQNVLYEEINFSQGTAVGDNLALIGTPLPLWRCPADPARDRIHCVPLNGSSYELAAGNYCGVEGILHSMSTTRIRDILDGTSHTFLLGERMVQTGDDGGLPFTSAWCGQVAFTSEYDYRSVPHLLPNQFYPINDSATNPSCFGSRHEGGANFALGDGSVRFINQHLSVIAFEALGTINGGEVFNMPE